MYITWFRLPCSAGYAPEGAQQPSVHLVSALPTFQLFSQFLLFIWQKSSLPPPRYSLPKAPSKFRDFSCLVPNTPSLKACEALLRLSVTISLALAGHRDTCLALTTTSLSPSSDIGLATLRAYGIRRRQDILSEPIKCQHCSVLTFWFVGFRSSRTFNLPANTVWSRCKIYINR